jgi:hypothetical protein
MLLYMAPPFTHIRTTLDTSIQHVPAASPFRLTICDLLCHLLLLRVQALEAKLQHAACAKRCSVLPDALRFFVRQMCHLLCLQVQALDAKSKQTASATRFSACLTLGSMQRMCHLLLLHLQALDAKSKQTACASRRSCAVAYPTREAHGLTWVWPSAGPEAAEEAGALGGTACLARICACESSCGCPEICLLQLLCCVCAGAALANTNTCRVYALLLLCCYAAATAVPVCQAVQDAPAGSLKWYRRELPYSWDILVENLTDPGGPRDALCCINMHYAVSGA